MYFIATILTIGPAICGVKTDTFEEPVLEKLDVFNLIPTNVFEISPRNDNMLSSEMLNLLEPVKAMGSIGESWVE
jgi:hypothetical protein